MSSSSSPTPTRRLSLSAPEAATTVAAAAAVVAQQLDSDSATTPHHHDDDVNGRDAAATADEPGKPRSRSSSRRNSISAAVAQAAEIVARLVQSTDSGAGVGLDSADAAADAADADAVTEAENDTTEHDIAEAPAEEEPGMLAQVAESFVTPGINAGVIKFMNIAFVGLFLALGFWLYASGANIHVIFLTVISVALFASVQW
ncbi:hypothetical protein CAOG_007457 [Capsaspora owczarzaki ATCC 30864]|uniref:Uncharacterized protein n=2 Tax=Capsaspora owczarzaki (strain ATCC 30864) TaxID=595528 RepID=A0A0D2X5D8_CAPO3|nr:hypothetical protein CAOG_007457 [Capsaspora owczarzaki ATCC 30864]